jgi:hypothetical protein
VDFRITSIKPYKRDKKEEVPEVTDPLEPLVIASSSPKTATKSTPEAVKAPVQRLVVKIPMLRINQDKYAIHPIDTML